MVPIRHLQEAPIIEAVFDFRVKAAKDFSVEDFARVGQTLSSQFPKMDAARGGQVRIDFRPGPPEVNTENLGLMGYFFKSEDEKLIAQFRIDGFTLNRLAPYTSWDELYPLATRLWQQYCDVATPQTVTRLAVRYINKIPLPWTFVDFDDYLTAGPDVPSGLPQNVPAFLLQVQILDTDHYIAANVIQQLESSLAEQKHSIVLDIDAFKAVDLSPSDPSIKDVFGQLRDFKNAIFFSYLTEEAIRRFE